MGGELGGRAPIVVEYKLRQDAVAPPQDDHTTAVPIGVAEPGRDIFAMGERKEIKSQVLVFDVPDVADDEKQISMVEFEPPHATPEPASSGKEEDKVHVSDLSSSAGAGEPEYLGDAEAFVAP
jgi:dolichyl-phosphate-mannose-protein mannosyltransferase